MIYILINYILNFKVFQTQQPVVREHSLSKNKESQIEKKFNTFFEDIGLTKVFRDLEKQTKPTNVTKQPEFAKDINHFFEEKGVTKGYQKG